MEYWHQQNVFYVFAKSKKLNKKSNYGYEKLEKCVTTTGVEMLARYRSSVTDPVLNGVVNGKQKRTSQNVYASCIYKTI